MIGVVIVTYRSEAYIEMCLRSLFRELQSVGEDYSLFLIDNASSDRAVNIAREVFEPIHVLENDKNLGFAKAANQGIRKCLDVGCTEVLLMNPDTEMEKKSLEKLISRIRDCDENKNGRGIGIVQPLITLMSDPNVVNTSGNVDRGLGFVSVGGYGKSVDEVKKKEQESGGRISYASGACMMVKKEVFEEVGLFDERFFLYFEDTEFSQRVCKAEWKIVLVADALVRHDYRVVSSYGKIWNVLKSWWKYVLLR
ncbi:MAG: glycosyltransferase family 2 protein [Candidatus Gracilibacteria bacterium]|nr:glycosyltransferase family 2 protein [Candidatus Gracilibacteria bacterium]